MPIANAGPRLSVKPELSQRQAQKGGNHREGGERDRLAHGADRLDHSVVRLKSSTELLTHPKDQKQAVVGASSQHQHDQQHLRDH